MFKTEFENLRRTCPLIHNITNYVTVNDCANMVLACGASPIMADDAAEVEDITSICGGLNINIGTLNSRTITSMLLAGKKANQLGHPVVLDPVGAGASRLRTDTAFRLLRDVKFTVIRGNISEIKTLASGAGTTKGVDADVADKVTEENLDSAVAFAKKYDILIIHDNAYSDIIFDGAVGNSFFNTPGAMDVGVEFFSLSKSFNVTGARISFLVGRRDVVAAFKKLRGQIDFGMFLPVQKAAIAALTGPLDMVKTQCGLYQQRRDALCGGLRSIGWNVPDSHGSMFVWAPIPAKYAKSMDFCLDLVEKSGVLCTPGSSFGPLGEGYVRFALTLPPERIAEAVQSIKASGILN